MKTIYIQELTLVNDAKRAHSGEFEFSWSSQYAVRFKDMVEGINKRRENFLAGKERGNLFYSLNPKTIFSLKM